MKHLLMVNMLLFTVLNLSSQTIRTKDGVSLGDAKQIINECVNSLNSKVVKLKGFEIDSKQYCECAILKVMPNLYSWEMEKAHKENKISDLLLRDDNFNILQNCVRQTASSIGENYKIGSSENPVLEKAVWVKSCITEFMNDSVVSREYDKKFAEEYCNCIIDKAVQSGFSIKEILNADDESSKIYNEAVIPCIASIRNNSKKPNTGSKTYLITGGGSSASIPLINYPNNEYKLKITISGIAKYYLLDTGAFELIIDRETEREFLINGVITKESYLGQQELVSINSQRVLIQKVKINSLSIGDYTLHDLTVGISEKGPLKIGKGLLERFSNWEVDMARNLLILNK